MTTAPRVDLDDFLCVHCHTRLLKEEGGTYAHATPFVGVVLTRARSVGKLKIEGSPDTITATQYAVVCSKPCFDAVRATWPRVEVPTATVRLAAAGNETEIDGELVAVNWGTLGEHA